MKLAAAFAGICVLACATTARAESLFEFFDAACLTTHASSAAALAVADGKHWSVMPADRAAGLGKYFGEAKADFRGRFSAVDRKALAVGDVAFAEAKSLPLSFCIVAGAPDAGESLKSEAAAFAAVPAQEHTPTSGPTFYGFTEDAGKHTQILHPEDDAVMLPLVQSGRLRVLVVMEQPTVSLIAIALPAKSPN